MKARTFLILALLLAFLSGGTASSLFAADASYQSKVYMKQGAEEQVIADGGTQTVESGGTINVQSGGKVDIDPGAEFARQATVINSYTQLSSWSGQAATNGVSYIQAEPGKAYEIDLAAIGASLPGMNFAGVTVVGNDASAANDQKPFTVTIIPPTGTTLASLVSGATPVYVVPYAGSGATSYGANATVPQSMQGDYMDANGVLTAGAVASGASTAFLTKIGDSAEYQTRNNSGVSLFAKNVTKKK